MLRANENETEMQPTTVETAQVRHPATTGTGRNFELNTLSQSGGNASEELDIANATQVVTPKAKGPMNVELHILGVVSRPNFDEEPVPQPASQPEAKKNKNSKGAASPQPESTAEKEDSDDEDAGVEMHSMASALSRLASSTALIRTKTPPIDSKAASAQNSGQNEAKEAIKLTIRSLTGKTIEKEITPKTTLGDIRNAIVEFKQMSFTSKDQVGLIFNGAFLLCDLPDSTPFIELCQLRKKFSKQNPQEPIGNSIVIHASNYQLNPNPRSREHPKTMDFYSQSSIEDFYRESQFFREAMQLANKNSDKKEENNFLEIRFMNGVAFLVAITEKTTLKEVQEHVRLNYGTANGNCGLTYQGGFIPVDLPPESPIMEICRLSAKHNGRAFATENNTIVLFGRDSIEDPNPNFHIKTATRATRELVNELTEKTSELRCIR